MWCTKLKCLYGCYKTTNTWSGNMCMNASGNSPLFPVAGDQSGTGTLLAAAGELLRRWDPPQGPELGTGTWFRGFCWVTPSLFLLQPL